jgi:hypothetical protein
MATTAQNIELVRQSLRQNGQRSSQCNGLRLSRQTFQHIVKFDLKFDLYVIIQRQKLRDGDPAICNQFVNMVEQNPAGFLDHLISILNSEINMRNVREYAAYGDGHPPDAVPLWAVSMQRCSTFVGSFQAE